MHDRRTVLTQAELADNVAYPRQVFRTNRKRCQFRFRLRSSSSSLKLLNTYDRCGIVYNNARVGSPLTFVTPPVGIAVVNKSLVVSVLCNYDTRTKCAARVPQQVLEGLPIVRIRVCLELFQKGDGGCDIRTPAGLQLY